MFVLIVILVKTGEDKMTSIFEVNLNFYFAIWFLFIKLNEINIKIGVFQKKKTSTSLS